MTKSNELSLADEAALRVKEKGFPFRAPPGFLLIQAHPGIATTASGLILNYRSEYPQSGWVVSSGAQEEDIIEGDFLAFEVESVDVAASYYRVFEIILNDEGIPISVVCKEEVEPLLRETVERYRVTKEDKWITLSDVTGEGWKFLASDVLSYQWAEGNSPAFSLLCPLRVRMFRWEGELYYKIHERDVLAVIQRGEA